MKGASVKMDIGVTGDDTRAFTELLIEGAADYRPLWKRTAVTYRKTQARRFRTQGASEGRRWARPSETGERDHYRYAKANILGISLEEVENRVLLWEGGRERLRPSFVRSGHPEHVDQREKLQHTLGSRVPYASKHDQGRGRAPDELGGHRIPKRSLTSISKRFRREILRDFGLYARDMLNESESKTPRYSSQQVRDLL